MADSRADDILRHTDQMKSARSTFESHWREIAERVLPRQNYFNTVEQTQGEKKTERIFDSTAPMALERFAAAMESMITPRTQKWHGLRVGDEKLDDNVRVKRWLDDVTNILFRARYRPASNFASQANENYMSLGAFGTGAVLVDDMVGVGLRYKSIHLSELLISENSAGLIDIVHRCFQLTARQAKQMFGEKCPQKVQDAAEKEPERKFDFVHAVMPNPEPRARSKDYRGMKYRSCYIFCEGREYVEEGGFRTFPYAVSRYVTAPNETYGRSPAMLALPDIKMLNEMEKTIIRAAHRVVDPPLLLSDDGALQGFQTRPGALNYGALGDQGQKLVDVLETGANLPLGLELSDQKRKSINDAFYVTLFQILVDAPAMTATEAMLRAQEKGALLAPSMGRQQSEFLGPLITRELDILEMAGVLPPMPPELQEFAHSIEIEYVSPLARAQRADEGIAILNTIQGAAPLFQMDPDAILVFNSPELVRELAEINGVPAKGLRSVDEVAALKEQRAQEDQAAAVLQAAPVAADAAKTFAETQRLASQPSPSILG